MLVRVTPLMYVPFAAAGYLAPWKEAGIDATDNIFVQGYTNLAKVNGEYYGVSYMRAPEARMCVVFNKGVLKSAGVDADGIYDLVKAKKWNWATMEDYAKKYPNYDFENNVGYGTKKHIESILSHGITPIHRMSFLKKIIGEEEWIRIAMERSAK